MVQNLNEGQFEAVMRRKKPAVIEFSALWCAPCRVLEPVFKELSKEITEADFYTVDVDRESRLAERFSVMSLPTIVILKDGEEIARIHGFSNKEHLMASIMAKI